MEPQSRKNVAQASSLRARRLQAGSLHYSGADYLDALLVLPQRYPLNSKRFEKALDLFMIPQVMEDKTARLREKNEAQFQAAPAFKCVPSQPPDSRAGMGVWIAPCFRGRVNGCLHFGTVNFCKFFCRPQKAAGKLNLQGGHSNSPCRPSVFPPCVPV